MPLRARAALPPLLLLLAAAGWVAAAAAGGGGHVHARRKCTLPPVTLAVYASGLAPSSPTSAHCERCVASFALSRLNQTDPASVFAFEDDSATSCLAVYIAGVLAMRTLCLDCTAEIAAVQAALNGTGEACSEPMQRAITLADQGCERITLASFPFGGTVARITCESAVPQVMSIFVPAGGDPPSKCAADLATIAAKADRLLAELPDSATLADVETAPVALAPDFVDVDGLDAGDMDAASELTGCYATRPYSLAAPEPYPFCDCLMEGGDADRPSPAVAAAQRVFQVTDPATFGVQSLMRESVRAVLVDAARCFGKDDGFFLVKDAAGGAAAATPAPTPLPSPTPLSSWLNPPDPNPNCFPAAASATLESGAAVRMDALAVGDRVAVGGAGRFSDVFLFTHADASPAAHAFLTLTTAAGPAVTVSAGHYVHVGARGTLVRADAVAAGDALLLADGARSAVVRVDAVRVAGLFNPQTLDGDIVVDGVLCSTYTAAVHPALAHRALLAPVRWLYAALPRWASRALARGLFDKGNPTLAALLPSGPAALASPADP